MRKELYNMLCKELKEVGGGLIKHIDLWNHNVEFIEQEENWERPAVFVEFEPIEWRQQNNGARRGDSRSEHAAEQVSRSQRTDRQAAGSCSGSLSDAALVARPGVSHKHPGQNSRALGQSAAYPAAR